MALNHRKTSGGICKAGRILRSNVMTRQIVRAVLLVIAGAAIPVAARHVFLQTPHAGGTGVIAGVTVDQATGRPLAGVAVHLRHTSVERRTSIDRMATSDAGGRFMFRDLPKGEWWIRATLAGWRGAEEADPHPQEDQEAYPLPSPKPLGEGQRIDDLQLGLQKFSTLTGRVVDSSGAPVVGADVNAMSSIPMGGRPTLVSGPTARTDAKGVYRFTALAAGQYVLTAAVDFTRMKEINPSGEPLFVFERAPSRTLSVKWGQTLPSVNFTLRKGPGVRVSGRVTGASSFRPQAYVHLVWTDPIARADQLFVANAYLDGHGNFRMAPVPPGRYELVTYGALSASGRMLWTRHPVVVGTTDITGLGVPIRSGLRVIGRAQFEGTRRRPTAGEMANMVVALSEPDILNLGHMMPQHATVNPDGTFISADMAAGPYVLRVWGEPDGWTLRSASIGGIDAADAPIQLTSDMAGAVLTFTDRTATLRGRVAGDQGQVASMVHVLVFPANPTLWTDFGPARRLRRVTTSADGTYEFDSLPAGNYLVAAVPTVPERGWRDEALLKSLATSAARVSLVEGGVVVQPLQLTPRTFSR